MRVTPELRRKIIVLCVRRKLSLRAAASRTGVSYETVRAVLGKAGYATVRWKKVA